MILNKLTVGKPATISEVKSMIARNNKEVDMLKGLRDSVDSSPLYAEVAVGQVVEIHF